MLPKSLVSENRRNIRKQQIICPTEGCEAKFRRYDMLRYHLFYKHDIEVEVEQLIFNTFDGEYTLLKCFMILIKQTIKLKLLIGEIFLIMFISAY